MLTAVDGYDYLTFLVLSTCSTLMYILKYTKQHKNYPQKLQWKFVRKFVSMCTPTEPQSLSSFHPITVCMLSLSAPNHCQLLKFKRSFYCQSAVIHLTLLRTTFTTSYVILHGDYLYILLLPLLCLIPLDHECDPLQGDVNPSGDLTTGVGSVSPSAGVLILFPPSFLPVKMSTSLWFLI